MNRALSRIEQLRAGAMDDLLPYIRQRIPAYPSCWGDERDEAGEEATHQEEETATILDSVEGWM